MNVYDAIIIVAIIVAICGAVAYFYYHSPFHYNNTYSLIGVAVFFVGVVVAFGSGYKSVKIDKEKSKLKLHKPIEKLPAKS